MPKRQTFGGKNVSLISQVLSNGCPICLVFLWFQALLGNNMKSCPCEASSYHHLTASNLHTIPSGDKIILITRSVWWTMEMWEKIMTLCQKHGTYPVWSSHIYTLVDLLEMQQHSINHRPRRPFDLNKCCLKIWEEGGDNRKPAGSSMCLKMQWIMTF